MLSEATDLSDEGRARVKVALSNALKMAMEVAKEAKVDGGHYAVAAVAGPMAAALLNIAYANCPELGGRNLAQILESERSVQPVH